LKEVEKKQEENGGGGGPAFSAKSREKKGVEQRAQNPGDVSWVMFGIWGHQVRKRTAGGSQRRSTANPWNVSELVVTPTLAQSGLLRMKRWKPLVQGQATELGAFNLPKIKLESVRGKGVTLLR